MKLSIFKTLFLALSTVMMVGLSGCGSSGDPINDGIGGEPAGPVEFVGVNITPANTYVLVGESEQFVATAVFSDGTTQDVTSTATWNISDTTIAVINQTGIATGVSVGSVTLAATYSVNGVEQTGAAGLDVLVTDPTLKSFETDGSDVVSVALKTQVNAVATLSDDTVYIVNDKVNWTSSAPTTATVDTAGLVTGLVEGPVTITATAKKDNSIVATHNMTVTEATIVSIQIELGWSPDAPTPITTLNVPITEEVYITAWGIYSDGSRHYINTDTIWWSEDQQIASINFLKSSKVYGRDAGSTTVIAYYGGLEASIAVAVAAQTNPSLESIDIISRTYGSVDAFSLAQGAKEWLTAYGNYDDGSRKDINRYVAYSSSDINVAYIIDEIDSNVHGRNPGGPVDITATWQGKTAKVAVTVTSSTIEIQEGCSSSETVVIDDSNPLELSVGEEKCINAWLVHEDGTKERVTTTVFWLSQDQSTASMDILQRNSFVVGENIGSTTVSATLEDASGSAPVNVSAYIPGTIRRSNFVNVDDLSLVVGTPPTSATGKADGARTGGGFYYTASTDGTYSAGDLVPNTDFVYDATMTNVRLFVNIYTTQDTNCPTDRISIGEGAVDPTVPYTYLTWNEAKTDPALAMCELRNWSELLRVGNFYLRFGDTSYGGTDAFTVNSYKVN